MLPYFKGLRTDQKQISVIIANSRHETSDFILLSESLQSSSLPFVGEAGTGNLELISIRD